MNDLSKKEVAIWKKINALVLTKKPKDYDEAVRLLVDLRDLGKRNKTSSQFKAKLKEIRMEHSRKPSLMRRIDYAGL